MLKDKRMPSLSDKLYGQPVPIKEQEVEKPKKAKAEKKVKKTKRSGR